MVTLNSNPSRPPSVNKHAPDDSYCAPNISILVPMLLLLLLLQLLLGFRISLPKGARLLAFDHRSPQSSRSNTQSSIYWRWWWCFVAGWRFGSESLKPPILRPWENIWTFWIVIPTRPSRPPPTSLASDTQSKSTTTCPGFNLWLLLLFYPSPSSSFQFPCPILLRKWTRSVDDGQDDDDCGPGGGCGGGINYTQKSFIIL